jgi:hypothetical protein
MSGREAVLETVLAVREPRRFAGQLRVGTSNFLLHVGQSIIWPPDSSATSIDWLHDGQLNLISFTFFYAEQGI